MEVFTTDHEGTVHLGRDDGAGQDTSTDGDFAGEWALLVYQGSNVSFKLFLTVQENVVGNQAGFAYRCRSPQWQSWAS